MAKDNDFDFLDSSGSGAYKREDLNAFSDYAERKKSEFLKAVIDKAVEYKLVNTGTLTSEEGYRIDVSKDKGVTRMEIYMIFYGLFQDRGVQGILKNDKAPDSPYKFKKWGMADSGRESIANSIRDGRIKISGKMAAKYEKIGLEKRSDKDTGDPVEQQADEIAYIIKAFGIQTRPFFKYAFEKTFGEPLKYELIEEAKKYFIAHLKFKNNK